MNGQSQPGSNIETRQPAAAEQKIESNLSETAQLVNGMMKEYIMPVLRDSGMVKKANEIIKAKLKADDPQVIEFALACREKQAIINARAEKEGCDEKKLAVIANFFSKFVTNLGYTEETPQPEAPQAEAPQEATA